MNRMSPVLAVGLLFYGGAVFAQSVEPPTLSGLAEAITGTVADAISGAAGDLPGSLGTDFGGPGFLDPETGDDDALDPESGDETGNDETGNEIKRRRPLDISVVGHDDVQGVVLVCKVLKAGGNPMEGLNLGGSRPKPKKQAEALCKVVSK